MGDTAVEALLDAVAAGVLDKAALAGDRVALGAGAPFPRDTVLQFEGTQIKPLRLDAAVVFIKHAARNGWNWKADIAAYIKEAREAGVAPVEIFDRQKLCDLFQDQGQPQQRAAKRLRVEGDAGPAVVLSDGLLDMPRDTPLSSCRQLHDRNSVLVSRSKTFAPVLQLLQSALKGGPAKPKEGKVIVAPAVKSSRYKGVQEQQFWQERLGTRDVDELGIDTNASFLAAPAVPLPAPETLQPLPAAAQPKQQAPQQHAGRHPPADKAEKKGGIPIIIVPSGLGSQVLVNMYNVQPFLEDCAFVPWEERKEAGMRKESSMDIKRRSGRNKPVVYHVTDKPPPKKSPDWARVVAVFVQGSAWQLKEFPFKGADNGNFLETFANLNAFFVRFDADPAPEFVKKWSVNTLVVSKNTRHSDKSVIDGFWTAMDNFLARKGSTLAY